jgi:hypothetical protein
MTCKSVILGVALLASCGNYSNEDLEFMNAVPASEDIAANLPPSKILPANEAELSRLTHDTVGVFNGALDFLSNADLIRSYQPTSRIPNGRVWGPFAMTDHLGWQWRFVVTRLPDTDNFNYAFDVQQIGADPEEWISFITGSFAASAGARKGSGTFLMETDHLRLAGFPVGVNEKGEMLKSLMVTYSTASYPVNVTMDIDLYPPNAAATDYTMWTTIHIEYEAQASGQGGLVFAATDSMGNSISVESRWFATGRGRADATVKVGPVMGQTRTECWDDMFRETYNYTPWDMRAGVNHGDVSTDCPDISTL